MGGSTVDVMFETNTVNVNKALCRQTDTQDDYRNPRACAPRVNNSSSACVEG